MSSPTFKCHQKSVSTLKPCLAQKTPVTSKPPSIAGKENARFRNSVGLYDRAEESGLAGECRPKSVPAESRCSSIELVFWEMVRSCSAIRRVTQVGLKAELHQEQNKI